MIHDVAHNRNLARDPRMQAPLAELQAVVDGRRAGIVDQVVHHHASGSAFEIRVPLPVAGVQVGDHGDVRRVVVNQAAFGVRAFTVRAVVQSFGDDAMADGHPVRGALPPLFGCRAAKTFARCRQVFVGRPTGGTVVDDDVVGSAARGDGVHFPAALLGCTGLAGPDKQMLQDYVVRLDADAALDDRDSW